MNTLYPVISTTSTFDNKETFIGGDEKNDYIFLFILFICFVLLICCFNSYYKYKKNKKNKESIV
jgi:hypothetical protein